MVLWAINHQMQSCPVDKIYSSFLNAWHVRKKPRNNGAGFLKPDGEKPAKEIHYLRFEFESSQDAHFLNILGGTNNLGFELQYRNSLVHLPYAKEKVEGV